MVVKEIEVKDIMTKTNLPVSDFAVNPYVGCTHACKYCYASFMKRFTNHSEPWGEFIDVKMWPPIRHPEKYAGKKIEVIDGASVDAAEGMDIYHQADIRLHFELEDGDKALVHFQIPASEFKAKGLTENDACLYHYDEDSGWTKLPTWHVTSGEYLIYESETDDFSPFAIVFEEDSAMSKESGEPATLPAELPIALAVLLVILVAGIAAAVIAKRK